MTIDSFSPEAYEHQLDEKLIRLQQDFAEFSLPALEVFRRRDVDILVLEVGLGGRLDAVNILDADVAVVAAGTLYAMRLTQNDLSTSSAASQGSGCTCPTTSPTIRNVGAWWLAAVRRIW